MTIQEMIQKLAEYKRAFQAIFISILLIFAGITFLYKDAGNENESKYAVLSEELEEFFSGKGFDDALYGSVSQFLQSHPESCPGIEQKVSQHLFALGQVEKGLSLAKKSLRRVESHLPYYSEFAQTSLVIEEKKYDQALTQALALQDKLQHDEQLIDESRTMYRGSQLMASNLLRIATLQRILGQQSQEFMTLTALKEFLGLSSGKGSVSTADKQTQAAFLAQFSSQSHSLSDYIHEREMVLR